MNTVPCKSCGARMAWVVTVNAKRMPLDPEPVPDGNVVLNDNGFARVLTKKELEQGADLFSGERYKSHYATCPQAKEWRKSQPEESQ